MRLLHSTTLLLARATFGVASSADGVPVRDASSGAKRIASQDFGRRMRRLRVDGTPDDSEPSDAQLSGLPSTVSMPEPRYTTPPRDRQSPPHDRLLPPGSPPEGTLVNLGSASTSPVTRAHPTTPPRPRRVVPVALENTPDRPSLYGRYEASEDVEPMITQVPEIIRPTRVGYTYSDALLLSLDRRTRELALLQISHDIENYKSAPQLAYSFEIVKNEDSSILPSGRSPIIRVNNVITNRMETTIMSLYGMPDNVIKYQSNCHSLLRKKSNLHPLLREYWISKYVDEEGVAWQRSVSSPHSVVQISPRVYFVSPPSLLPISKTSKTDFSMEQSIRDRCVRAEATVRYMIMERTGSNMEDFMSLHNETTNRIEFKLGMKILHQLISRLKILHSIGIIHGDVHMGNIVRALGGSRDQFLLIDYGMGSFYDETKPLPETPKWEDGRLIGTPILTHWQMKGYVKSFRDDILRAMMTVGRIINGPEYIGLISAAGKTEAGLGELVEFFGKGDIFSTPVGGGFNPLSTLENVSEEARLEISEKLRAIRQHVQGISEVNTKPNYDFLLREIERIQILIQ